METAKVVAFKVKRNKPMLTVKDVMDEFGFTRHMADQTIHKYGVKIGGRWFIAPETLYEVRLGIARPTPKETEYRFGRQTVVCKRRL